MNKLSLKIGSYISVIMLILVFTLPISSQADIEGIIDPNSNFNLSAEDGYITTPEGGVIYMWGYSDDDGGTLLQYPGPTLIVTQDDVVEVTLTNGLSGENTSIVFPGHVVTASGGVEGLLTKEAVPGSTVMYTFTATNPGTYTYYSGTRQEIQIEMGLIGAIIVRPKNYNPDNPRAYEHGSTSYDLEYLFLLTDMDPAIHDLVLSGNIDQVDNSSFWPVYWFINGRAFPDTLFETGAPWLPTQPYGSLVTMNPGQKVLMRVIGAGRDLHPFHHHGNNATIIAKDGRLLSSDSQNADLAQSVFTITSAPGQTVDAIFEWTGEKLGWDIHGDPAENGHSCDTPGGFDTASYEYCPDHGKPFPVVLPEIQNVTIGGAYSGSPYMGQTASLPPGEGGLNEPGAFVFPWHSHAEKEIINNDVFIGGMLTLLYVLPY